MAGRPKGLSTRKPVNRQRFDECLGCRRRAIADRSQLVPSYAEPDDPFLSRSFTQITGSVTFASVSDRHFWHSPLCRGVAPSFIAESDRGYLSPYAGSVRPVSDAAVLILGSDDRCDQPEFLIPRTVHIALGYPNRTRPALGS
jgi:hypothetical protein